MPVPSLGRVDMGDYAEETIVLPRLHPYFLWKRAVWQDSVFPIFDSKKSWIKYIFNKQWGWPTAHALMFIQLVTSHKVEPSVQSSNTTLHRGSTSLIQEWQGAGKPTSTVPPCPLSTNRHKHKGHQDWVLHLSICQVLDNHCQEVCSLTVVLASQLHASPWIYKWPFTHFKLSVQFT